MSRSLLLTPSTTSPSTAAAAKPDAILAEVLVYSGQTLLASYAIEQGEYIIGRDSVCQIHVDANEVSPRHARLTFSGDELLVEDLASGHGVFLNGVRVQVPTRVWPDQEVQIGSARLVIRLKHSSTSQCWTPLEDANPKLGLAADMLTGRKHEVITTIGRGGMGVVMQARDLRIRRTVAMKVMKSGQQFSRDHVLRFVGEAQLTGQLEHPNIVPVYELGTDEQGAVYYTMKYVKGITLEDVLRGLRGGHATTIGRYPLATLITIFQKICDAVAFAHSKGIVHRDLKPENIMIGSYGEVMVMDWGLAKTIDSAAADQGTQLRGQTPGVESERAFQTMHGAVIGTPPYISPEQARGENETADPRSDIYVLGALLYAILTLRAPVGGSSTDEIVNGILGSRIVHPSDFNQPARRTGNVSSAEGEGTVDLVHCPGRRIPDGLAAVAMKAMQFEPPARYQTVEEMQADITAFQGGFAPKAEGASRFKQLVLFAGRHRREVALLVIGLFVINTMLVTFFVQLTAEKNRALASENRAIESEQLAADRLAELRGTAPTFYADAVSLVEAQRFEDALDKINYAIAQVPNSAEYRFLRANILQTLLRFDEAVDAYEETLQRNERHSGAVENLELTRKIVANIGEDGRVTRALLRELHSALVNQKRIAEALAVLTQIGRDKELFSKTWKAAFAKRGLRQRFETNDGSTLSVDLSRVAMPDLRKLRGAPIVSLTLDDTRLPDISALSGLPLQRLSLNRTLVRELSPLTGMPLRSLSIEGAPVQSLAPLSGLPLEILRLTNSRISDLSPLRGIPLEQLTLAGCRHVKDLAPLAGMPLQNLDLSRTAVTDLRPLIGSPLRELNLEGCADLEDLRPLLEMTSLEAVLLPAQCTEVLFLRDHPSLKRLSYKKMTEPVSEFWEQFRARR